MKIFTLLLAFISLLTLKSNAQFSSISQINPVPVTTNTKDKPQSKTWTYGGKHWAVMTKSDGAYLWRLDGNTWTSVLKLASTTYARADCKPVGNVTHILLERGVASHLVSVEFVPKTGSYKLWSARTGRVPIALDEGVETATLEMDGAGRMWIASDGRTTMNVRYSDFPYAVWSGPVTVADNVLDDDICSVIAMPAAGKIGVFWSNQNTRRFGFKTHIDGQEPSFWSTDEVPAGSSAINVGGGMADDHMNLKVAADGTLYAAVKTSYDKTNYPRLALLVRRPAGTWDHLYTISQTGTRPIVWLNEAAGKLKIIYAAAENGGDILYRETAIGNIAFGAPFTLIKGVYNYPSGSKQTYNPEAQTVFLASTETEVTSVICTDSGPLANLKIQGSFSAYPNPFLSSSTIRFVLPETGDYAISLYDFKGTHLGVLKAGKAAAGELNTLEANGENLSAGLYVVRIQTSKETYSVRLIRDK